MGRCVIPFVARRDLSGGGARVVASPPELANRRSQWRLARRRDRGARGRVVDIDRGRDAQQRIQIALTVTGQHQGRSRPIAGEHLPTELHRLGGAMLQHRKRDAR